MTRAIVAFLLAPSVFASELAITGGGRRIVDINPPGTSCRAWSYGAMPVVGDAGTVDAIYSAGDIVANHCRDDLTSPNRFGDRIWRHVRNADGTWSGAPVIAREALPWMSAATADSYVAHLASPAVVRVGGRWYMAFSASVSDPNLCAGEHGAPTSCGSCTSPWSHFAMLWAVSDDGVAWRVRDRGGDNANSALAAAVLWREPDAGDVAASSGYKSLARVSMLSGTDNGKTYFYILGMFWAARTPKEVLVRIPYDGADAWGLGGAPEVLHFQYPNHHWEACPNGRLPDWLDDFQQYSIVNGFFNAFASTVFATTRVPGYRYVALGIGHGYGVTGLQGMSNAILYQLSNDLITWTPQSYVRSSVDFFADGRGYSASVIDPVAVEDAGGAMHLYLASDDDGGGGAPRDGVPDCAADPSFGATAAYVGVGIYEAALAWVDLPATHITVTPPALSVTAGTVRYVVRVTAADGSIPGGIVSLSADDGFLPATAALHDGVAEVFITLKTGQRLINARYNNGLAPFQPSSTTFVQQVVPPSHRRAAAH